MEGLYLHILQAKLKLKIAIYFQDNIAGNCRGEIYSYNDGYMCVNNATFNNHIGKCYGSALCSLTCTYSHMVHGTFNHNIANIQGGATIS